MTAAPASGEVSGLGQDVLAVDGLSVRAGRTPLLHEVSFVIRRGERVGLIGESGSGKSLTALSVMGLLGEGLSATGRAWLAARSRAEQNLLTMPERELARLRGDGMSMVFQEPMSALNPTMKVGAQVAEVMLLHDTHTASGTRPRVLELLGQVGLSDPEHLARAYPHELSGGQRQRVVLAIALANDPALLICDEPTTALDVTVQAKVLDLVVAGVEARDAALLFITHDLAVVASVCERVLVMYGGRIVEAGPVQEVFTDPRHRYTQGLLAAADLTGEIAGTAKGQLPTIPGTVPPAGEFPEGCVFSSRCRYADSECAAVPPWTGGDSAETGSVAAGFACHHPAGGFDGLNRPEKRDRRHGLSPEAPSAPFNGPLRDREQGLSHVGAPAVELVDVSREFRRRRTSIWGAAPVVRALDRVSLTIEPGERFGIVGESGSGKSTLLRQLCGLDRPTSGEVNILGRPVHDQRSRSLGWLRETVQLVFQDPMGSLDPRMRVRDIIAEPLVAQGHRDIVARVDDLLEAVGLSRGAARRYPHQFSGGQRQRISVARALAPNPQILAADEPVSALDVSVRAQVLNLIDEVVEELDLTLVFVSHDLSVVRHVCDRVAVMRDGRIVEIAATEQLWSDPQHPYTQELLGAVPDLGRALALSC